MWDCGDGMIVEFPYRVTAVLVRRGDRWLWHTHHGSEPMLLDLPSDRGVRPRKQRD